MPVINEFKYIFQTSHKRQYFNTGQLQRFPLALGQFEYVYRHFSPRVQKYDDSGRDTQPWTLALRNNDVHTQEATKVRLKVE